MVQFAKIGIICNSTDVLLKNKYFEFKKVCAKYCVDEEMELYYIPLSSSVYEFAHNMAALYPPKDDVFDESPALCVTESENIQVEYDKGDYDKAVAYIINFWYFAYDYDDRTTDEYVGNCCDNPSWKMHKCLIQRKGYMIPKSEFRKKKFAKLMLGYAFADEVKDLLVDNLLASEDDFKEVTTKKGDHVCYQIIPQNIIDGFMEENGAELVDSCSNCGTQRYNPCKQPYRMSKELISKLQGLNRTKEMVGSVMEDSECNIPNQEERIIEPLYIVNKDTYIFLHKKYPRMQFIPIFSME